MSTTPTNAEELRAEVSARYARTALKVLGTEQPGATNACCAPTCCTPSTTAAAASSTALPVVEAKQAVSAPHGFIELNASFLLRCGCTVMMNKPGTRHSCTK
jgi:hypothetical protein